MTYRLVRRLAAFTIMGLAGLPGAAMGQGLPGGFVYLRDLDPSIVQDMRYATANNFVGRVLAGYEAGECIVTRKVGVALKPTGPNAAPP